MADQLHTHHRQRVLERFRRFGLAAFADHEVLELLKNGETPEKEVIVPFQSVTKDNVADYQ